MRNAIGIDIGGTNIRVAVGDEKGRIFDMASERTDPRNMEKQLLRMIDSKKVDFDGIGIGSAGPLDSVNGIITNPPNMDIHDFRIVDILRKRYDVECTLLNDCIAAVYGEAARGAGKGLQNVAYVTISTGIGCGVIESGKLLLGKDGNGHEMGHCGVDAEIRMKCGCGSMGRHWEAYASGSHLPDFVKHMLSGKYKDAKTVLRGQQITPKKFFELAAEDSTGAALLDELGRINASGIANVVNAYDPELITLGGSVALNNLKQVIDPINEYVKDYAINRVPKIIATPLGEDPVLVGAIAYALKILDV